MQQARQLNSSPGVSGNGVRRTSGPSHFSSESLNSQRALYQTSASRLHGAAATQSKGKVEILLQQDGCLTPSVFRRYTSK